MATINKQSTTYWSRLHNYDTIEVTISEETDDILIKIETDSWDTYDNNIKKYREIADIIEQLKTERDK
jgi:hypothetical protein